jgi:hypothetical protein
LIVVVAEVVQAPTEDVTNTVYVVLVTGVAENVGLATTELAKYVLGDHA